MLCYLPSNLIIMADDSEKRTMYMPKAERQKLVERAQKENPEAAVPEAAEPQASESEKSQERARLRRRLQGGPPSQSTDAEGLAPRRISRSESQPLPQKPRGEVDFISNEELKEYGIPERVAKEYRAPYDKIGEEKRELERSLYDLNVRRLELQRQIESKKKMEESIENIAEAFDVRDFQSVLRNLRWLEAAGVEKLRLGDEGDHREYSMKDMLTLVDHVMAYSANQKSSLSKISQRTREHIDTDLARLGVTSKKISPVSKKGFRECLVDCVMNDKRTSFMKLDE